MSITDLLTYYAQPGRMTDPQDLGSLFDDLPTDIAAVRQIIQGVTLHIFWAERYGVKLSEERQKEVTWRSVTPKLKRLLELDARPLAIARPPEQRVVGNCRDFSTLLTAILRCKGIPARARCGFGVYFLPNHYEDHWVTEYWNAAQERWVLVDAQLDQLMIEALGISFDPLDVPRDQFVVAGQAWQMCRRGQANPDDFGIFDMKGLWFVRGNVVRDFLAFNKEEILPWDGGWGLLSQRAEEATPEEAEFELIDHLAALTTAGDGAFPAIRALYLENKRLRFPEEWEPVIHQPENS